VGLLGPLKTIKERQCCEGSAGGAGRRSESNGLFC